MDKKRKTDTELGLIVYEIISSSGMTDAKIAEKLHVSERCVAYYKTGQRRISQLNLLKLVKITETDIQKLEIP